MLEISHIYTVRKFILQVLKDLSAAERMQQTLGDKSSVFQTADKC